MKTRYSTAQCRSTTAAGDSFANVATSSRSGPVFPTACNRYLPRARADDHRWRRIRRAAQRLAQGIHVRDQRIEVDGHAIGTSGMTSRTPARCSEATAAAIAIARALTAGSMTASSSSSSAESPASRIPSPDSRVPAGFTCQRLQQLAVNPAEAPVRHQHDDVAAADVRQPPFGRCRRWRECSARAACAPRRSSTSCSADSRSDSGSDDRNTAATTTSSAAPNARAKSSWNTRRHDEAERGSKTAQMRRSG